MKTLTVKVTDSLAAAIGRVAALQGKSREEWLLMAIRCLLESDLDAHVGEILGVDPEAVS